MRKSITIALLIFIVLNLTSCAKNPVNEVEPEPSSVPEDLIQTEQDETDWSQYIIESGVFDGYCPNNALISFYTMGSQYSIQAQPKDIPTISAMKNSDGTWSAIRNYIVNKEFTYVKNQVEKHAELEIRLLGYPVQLDAVACSLYVPNANPSNYTFTYDSNRKIIYKSGKDDEMKFAQDLQNKILSCCEETMTMLKRVDEEAHGLLADILNKKGLGPVVWDKIEPSSTNNNANNIVVPQGDKVYFGNFEVNHSFDAIGIPPTYIRIIENDTVITWGVEAGLGINTENNPYGGTFTGFMTEIAENIYAVDGDFFYLDYAGQYDNLVSEDIDFYIILKGDTLYGVFEPISVSDLEKYIPADVYKYGGDK